MSDYLFNGALPWFTIPALIGTGIFGLFIILMLVGGLDIDADADFDADVDADGDASADSFKLLSIQSISAFLMGFGWGGFAAYKTFANENFSIALAVGAICGVGIAWLLVLGLKALYQLESSGNVSVKDAVGLEGEVYVRVPAMGEGSGKVRVVIDERQRIYNAVTEGEEISRSSRVVVTHVVGNTLTVVRA